MDQQDLARDNSGTRGYATFISELSELIPDTILPSMSLLLTHLDGEVILQTMRGRGWEETGPMGLVGSDGCTDAPEREDSWADKWLFTYARQNEMQSK